jgi:hypothetical protein
MLEKLNATAYVFSKLNYTRELERVLNKITFCFNFMLEDNIKVPANDENKIRDILLLKYLKNDVVRKEISLTEFLFEREVQEDSTNGRSDIKILTPNSFVTQAAYYIIECKRLDNKAKRGTSGLNAEYIKNGIYRFVENHYSSHYNANAMIGFVVEPMNIDSNIDDLNYLLKNNYTNANTISEISKENFILDLKYHYSSFHKTKNGIEIKLFHLMFDFSKNICN